MKGFKNGVVSVSPTHAHDGYSSGGDIVVTFQNEDGLGLSINLGAGNATHNGV